MEDTGVPIMVYRIHFTMSEIPTRNVSGERHDHDQDDPLQDNALPYKIKSRTCHTSGNTPKSYIKLVVRAKIDTSNIQIRYRSLS